MAHLKKYLRGYRSYSMLDMVDQTKLTIGWPTAGLQFNKAGTDQ